MTSLKQDLALQEEVCRSIINDIEQQGNLKDKLITKYHDLKKRYTHDLLRGEEKEET
jgi:hypothetical protein